MSPVAHAHADAVVVGGGVIGAAIAHQLALAGIGRIVLCDQGRVNAQGATSRSGGLLRLHHTASADTRLAARSLPVFEQWADIIGGDCGYRRTGFVMIVGEERADALRTNAAVAAAAAGYRRVEVVERAELREIYPGLRTEGVGLAAYEPEGGYADPMAASAALLTAAYRLGVSPAEGIRAVKVLEHEGSVTGVLTSVGRIDSPLVVLAGGAWGSAPVEYLGLHIPVTARRIGLAQAELRGAGRRGHRASVPTCIDDTTGSYFRPDGLDRFYFGVPSKPDTELGRDVEPLSESELESAIAAISHRVPAAAEAPLVGTRSGVDGYTPDKRPVVGAAGPDGLYLAIGFSGGGFKLAPAVAELAALEILEGGAVPGKAEQELLNPYRPQRFLAGHPIRPEAPYDHM
ncbi:NAD(P)/FAD-dependent oxidoreductase [Actinacidiphila yeochonensis]|uniref:NAD(P)/FAD-dependent oxidoreductase n=1 Tax=Actinacidiphila yeochonensis TaxID=89050 RepID=UPI00056012D7|nr:FAD-dependent oxidoreductase [Actinacidiphila yeochonensis]